MSTHKALVLESYGQPLTIEELPTPIATPGSVLIEPLYAFFPNHTAFLFSGKAPYHLSLPLTPGYACVARVETAPADATSIKPGNLVWVDPTISARDDPNTQILIGLHGGDTEGSKKLMSDGWRNGTWAEKAIVPLENCFLLPDTLFKSKAEGGRGYHYKDIATFTHILVPFGGLEIAGVGAGKTVIIAPATGKFSGGAILAALAMGAKVVAASRSAEGLRNLFRFPGAQERLTTVQLTGDIEKDAASLLSATGGKGAHVYMDISPPAASGPTNPAHFSAAIKVLQRNGQVILEGGVHSDLHLNYFTTMFKNLSVRGNFMYERKHVEQAIRMLENGNLVVGEAIGLTTKGVFGLHDVEAAFKAVEGGSGWGEDVVLAPNGEKPKQ